MEIRNETPFPIAKNLGYLSDEEMLVTVALKVTCILQNNTLKAVEEANAWPVFSKPVVVEGHELPNELHYGRQAVDIFVFGKAHAPESKALNAMQVQVACGQLDYRIDVIGDRQWVRNSAGTLHPSAPQPFQSMPLSSDRAYGGKAIMDGLEIPYQMNSVGRGYSLDEKTAEGTPLPNLERPGEHVEKWDDQPEPGCFLMPPASSLGQDKRFKMDDNMPVAPTPLLFQSAVPDLIIPPDLLGSSLHFKGFSPDGEICYPLPGPKDIPLIRATVGEKQSVFPLELSTIVALTEYHGLVLTFQKSFRYYFDVSDLTRKAEVIWNPQWLLEPQQTHTTKSQPISLSVPVPEEPNYPIPPNPHENTPSTKHVFVAQPETGKPQLFVAVRRTYSLDDAGQAFIADEQLPLPDDHSYYGDAPEGVIASCEVVPEGVYKTATDIVVQGFAHTYDNPVAKSTVEVRIGATRHVAQVFGNRICELKKGNLVFSDPELFSTISLRYENAYGGRDKAAELIWLEAIPSESRQKIMPFLPDNAERFSPFVYPRNPSGKGFVISEDLATAHGRDLPNLEDPLDLLTPDRLLIRQPEHWGQQPLPVGFGFLEYSVFPRIAMLGYCPDYLPEGIAFPEVERGFVASDFNRSFVLSLPPSRFEEAIHHDASRTGSLGLSLPYLSGEEEVELVNIHPRHPRYTIQLPSERPSIHVRYRKKNIPLEMKVYTLLIQPEEDRLSMVWCGGIPIERMMTPLEVEDVEYQIEWLNTRR